MNYDMNALYLYNNGFRFEIGQIEKINEKSIRMSSNHKVSKDEFNTKVYKLTEEEAKCYKGELIKKLSIDTRTEVTKFINEIILVKRACQQSPLLEVNTSKLQDTVNQLEVALRTHLPSTVTINGQKFEFNDFSTSLRRVEECMK